MAKNLVIVESPAKAKTIEGYLGKDFVVKSSFGHVRDLPIKGDKAIDVENDFAPTYVVSADKTKVISELKSLAKSSEEVWLATDDDREGEAISWHLKEALGLKDNAKRIVFREITKPAILQAITQPRTIDMDLVNAQQARRIMDRLIGFELSPVLWSKVQKGLSAGRVQSVAVRLIVEREREIENHEAVATFKVVAHFDLPGKKVLKAELSKAFAKENDALDFLKKCVGAAFSIKSLETKPAKKTPAPPFTTSTLQQEASRKLGFAVATTMSVAQKLYESGRITYMRTDSTMLSQEARDKAKAEIESAYGAKFHYSRQFKTKSESAQEAHEAIRPTDFANHSITGDAREKRLYELIWKRAIASQMADALIERTTALIDISTTPELLSAQGEVIAFEGFLKAYLEGKDDEEEDENKDMLPPLNVGQVLALDEMKAQERFTRAAPRYTEASLVKALEEKGIGRPSTYAPTISTIIKRAYVVKEDRPGREREFQTWVLSNNEIAGNKATETVGTEKAKLFPTHIGTLVTDFLVENFENVVDYTFTAEMEDEFDNIAKGKLEWTVLMKNFYKSFHQTIEDSKSINRSSVGGGRELGVDPKTGRLVSVRLGKFGPFVQLGESSEEEKPVFANLMKTQSVSTLTFEEALALLERPKLPREVGIHNDMPVIIGAGKLGPYIKYDGKFTSLPDTHDPFTIEMDQAIAVIAQALKDAEAGGLGYFEDSLIETGKGRFGPYVKHNGKYYSLAKTDNLATIDQARAIELIEAKRKVEANKFIKEFAENETVKVVNGMYGPYIQIGKRNVKIPKGTEPADLTLEECLALGDAAPAPKKARKK
ncbi:type I DNA topoisomerase [Aquirufa antheringensis]|uniref:DNA topoisomerase 1 n=1 Tax=Aquirufa antheringensis TaxID=2516559 RepID=A0A4Q9BB03_9BACT|nr:type I DNA topoisomerase [Aquirufa antheringensis]MCZ2485929.1 type I DNA topoisomerase [Aquirufa antheringensis]TBH73290.1 type I DNA topoisomerase [Aquirufa antheringensis]